MGRELAQALKVDESQFAFGETANQKELETIDQERPKPSKTTKPKREAKGAKTSDEVVTTLHGSQPSSVARRSKLTTHILEDLLNRLRQESLRRRLDGVTPNEIQEIADEAFELWFSQQGPK